MDLQDKVRIQRQCILRLMAAIEDHTGKMFHEILPEIDTEFNELAYNDYPRLRAIKIGLDQYLDDLKMD